MNSPLPKPTPPKNSDDSKQNVVFDKSSQSNGTPGTTPKPTTDVKTPTDIKPSDSQPRIPLAQKPTDQSLNTSGDTQVPKPTLPPTSLSALSSMSSNKIPAGATGSGPAKPIMPQTTVLGQPIPQAIRGEATPAGFGSSTPAPFTPAPVPTLAKAPASPVPTPVTPPSTSSQIKQENPDVGVGNDKKAAEKTAPKIATAKSPVMKFLPFIVGGLVLLIIVVVVLSRLFGGGGSTSVANNQATTPTTQNTNTTNQQGQRTEVPSQRVAVEYWGLWEPSEVMEQVITDFENENPGIQINYVKQSPTDYRERLETAIKSGNGPDIFRFHASWVPMLKNSLSPIPASVVSSSEFKSNYYPIVSEQLVHQGQYVGLPLMYDGLVLFYNEDILNTASETPPTTWSQLRTLAVKLTVPSASGIQRGGLAIGNATNVEHFSDILATLILQNGGNLTDASSVETRDALLFYTNFQLTDKVWNETLPSSTVAFARGDVAMMFAPSWRAHEIKALNPDLKFATAPMPQLSEDEKFSWASYWAEGISSESDNADEAAKFLAYLNRKDVLMKFFSEASKVRAFGEIYPKVDMAGELSENSIVNPILEDALYAKSGYMNSYTHDNGINDQTIKYYKTAIDSIIGGTDAEDVQSTLDQGVKQVLKQYGVSAQ